MHRKSRSLAAALALAMLVSSTATVAAPAPPSVADAFGGTSAPGVQALGDADMENTQGRLALVPVIAAIVSVDLALAGFFWGVYLPTVYASGGGGGGGGPCPTCYKLEHHR